MDYLNLIKVGTRVEPLALFVLTNQYIWKLKGNERVRCNISVKIRKERLDLDHPSHTI